MTSFRNRLFVVIAGVVLAIEALTMFAALRALERDAVDGSARGLQIGERVFRELFATREQQLATGVRVLADDFGFKEAVATGDLITLDSVLANHGRRISADLVAFITPQRQIAASTHRFTDSSDASTPFPFAQLLADAGPNGTAASTVVLPDGAFQLVAAPVYAPQLLGWVTVGFSVNDLLAGALKDLTGLEVSFITTAPGAVYRLPASTLSSEDRDVLLTRFRYGTAATLGTAPEVLQLAATDYLSHALDLTGNRTVIALLQRSMTDALAGYHRLLDQLAVIFLVALVIAVVTARFVAGGVTQPLDRLAAAARRIAGGRYNERVQIDRRDELGVLATAFNDMQTGIAEREEQILHQSRHDALTDLPNRVALHDRLGESLARTTRHARSGAVLMLDLRGFKAINDTFGHDTGDDALRALAGRLLEQARNSDTVARYGGNCFVIVVEDVGDADLRALAQRLLGTVLEPMPLPHAQVRLDLTIGISLFPEHGVEAEALLRRAEIAMYSARTRNDPLAFYLAGQDETHLRKLELMTELTKALEQDQLAVFFQPKLDLRSGRVTQAEALIRWQHATLGFVSPGEFVPIAEQGGLMRQLTATVLRKVAAYIEDWTSRGIDIVVSVNVSTIDLADTSFPERVAQIIAAHGVPAARVTLEITESALMSDPEGAGAVLVRLRDAGFKLSIDDFGTGYSSLAQLKQMPVSELKVDKSFVLGLPESADDAVIVRSTIELGHNLGLTVVAEGVEHERCIRFLRDAGCDMAQGYGISRPISAEDFVTWLSKRESIRLPASSAPRLAEGEQLVLQT